MLFSLLSLVLTCFLTTSCGYQVGSMMHPQIQSIAVADVKNDTKEPYVSSVMRGNLAEQFQVTAPSISRHLSILFGTFFRPHPHGDRPLLPVHRAAEIVQQIADIAFAGETQRFPEFPVGKKEFSGVLEYDTEMSSVTIVGDDGEKNTFAFDDIAKANVCFDI